EKQNEVIIRPLVDGDRYWRPTAIEHFLEKETGHASRAQSNGITRHTADGPRCGVSGGYRPGAAHIEMGLARKFRRLVGRRRRGRGTRECGQGGGACDRRIPASSDEG